MASEAPKAQHDPQLPWSRISPIDGQFGQASRESKFSGRSSFLKDLVFSWLIKFNESSAYVIPQKSISNYLFFNHACDLTGRVFWPMIVPQRPIKCSGLYCEPKFLPAVQLRLSASFTFEIISPKSEWIKFSTLASTLNSFITRFKP